MKHTKLKKPLFALAALAALGAGAGTSALVSAQTATPTVGNVQKLDKRGPKGMHGKGHPGVHGTVSAINGNTITLTDEKGTLYTVSAESAKVTKISTVTVADLKVGDTLGVRGTVNGTAVAATDIMSGFPANK